MLSQKQLDKQNRYSDNTKANELRNWNLIFTENSPVSSCERLSNIAREEDKKTIENDRKIVARDQIKRSWIFNQQLW